MLSRRARALALSLLAVAGAGALTAQGLARARRDAPLDPPRAAAAVVVAAPVEAEPPATATAAPAELAPEPPTARVEVAAEAPESLADTLRAGDTGASIAAIEAAAERGDVGALRDLERIDPDRDPYVTSVAVRAIAHIAAAAPSVERDGAARTLGRWLGDASRKLDAASRGHASLLVDAEAEAALARAGFSRETRSEMLLEMGVTDAAPRDASRNAERDAGIQPADIRRLIETMKS